MNPHKVPIYIPSKGRPGNVKTLEHLAQAPNPLYLVVEPQEESAYRAEASGSGAEILILPENDRGIAYVRNWIKQHGEEEWYWMLDDDITGFKNRMPGDTKLSPISGAMALAGAFSGLSGLPGCAQAGLEYQQFAWSATRNYATDTYCDVAVLINRTLTRHIHYRDVAVLKEDRDFTMQVIKAGHHVYRTTLKAFSAPKNGSNAGGLKPVYDQSGREEAAVDAMVKLWGPDIVGKQVKPDGRIDCKIHWKNIRSNQVSLF